MSNPLPLPVFDRRSNELFHEFMDDSSETYESKPHRSIVQWISSSPTIDSVIAAFQNTRFSARKIEPFIRKHKIDMSEFEPGPFESYAAFFERRFLPGKRTFPERSDDMGAFAEARYFAWKELGPDQLFRSRVARLKPRRCWDQGLARRVSKADGHSRPVVARRLPSSSLHRQWNDSGDRPHWFEAVDGEP